MVSPSELPDSPGGTTPSSPSAQRKSVSKVVGQSDPERSVELAAVRSAPERAGDEQASSLPRMHDITNIKSSIPLPDKHDRQPRVVPVSPMVQTTPNAAKTKPTHDATNVVNAQAAVHQPPSGSLSYRSQAAESPATAAAIRVDQFLADTVRTYAVEGTSAKPHFLSSFKLIQLAIT